MNPAFFTRVRLRRDVPAAAIRDLLASGDESKRIGAGHKLIWTLFADRDDRDRDFLWRESESGVYFTLSAREPVDRHGLFEIDPPKAFAPALEPGDRLRFSLRANATIARKTEGARRGKVSDVVMDALYRLPRDTRADNRRDVLQEVGSRWLAGQGERKGFSITRENTCVTVSGYRVVRVDHAGPQARLGVLDLDGVLEVNDPSLFLSALVRGFGRAKAFGCGLMLIRRP